MCAASLGLRILSRERYGIVSGLNKIRYEDALHSPLIAQRLEAVKQMRLASKAGSTRDFARVPYRFVQIQGTARVSALIVPRHSSERRAYLPVGLLDADNNHRRQRICDL